MLIDAELDDAEVLQAEDEAIAAQDTEPGRTALDDLTELLNGDKATLRPDD